MSLWRFLRCANLWRSTYALHTQTAPPLRVLADGFAPRHYSVAQNITFVKGQDERCAPLTNATFRARGRFSPSRKIGGVAKATHPPSLALGGALLGGVLVVCSFYVSALRLIGRLFAPPS